jgi:hypothetical protein
MEPYIIIIRTSRRTDIPAFWFLDDKTMGNRVTLSKEELEALQELLNKMDV